MYTRVVPHLAPLESWLFRSILRVLKYFVPHRHYAPQCSYIYLILAATAATGAAHLEISPARSTPGSTLRKKDKVGRFG